MGQDWINEDGTVGRCTVRDGMRQDGAGRDEIEQEGTGQDTARLSETE